MSSLFFFNDTATTEIYTLSLHDALPILGVYVDAQGQTVEIFRSQTLAAAFGGPESATARATFGGEPAGTRPEEHTSELQSRQYLVCRLLLEKKRGRCRALPCRTQYPARR